MSDVKEFENKDGKKAQNPIESAVNKLKEGLGKDLQKKIDEKIKAAMDARNIFRTLKAEIRELEKEKIAENLEFAEFVKEMKA